MFCNKCGANILEGAKVCSKCGERMPQKEKCSGFADIFSFKTDDLPKTSESTVSIKTFDSTGLENDIRKLSRKTDMVIKTTKKAYLFSVISLAISVVIVLVSVFSMISSGDKAKENDSNNQTTSYSEALKTKKDAKDKDETNLPKIENITEGLQSFTEKTDEILKK